MLGRHPYSLSTLKGAQDTNEIEAGTFNRRDWRISALVLALGVVLDLGIGSGASAAALLILLGACLIVQLGGVARRCSAACCLPCPLGGDYSAARRRMFFRVENLGPLREAEVDLSKDLILLTGPNNTGKTYLAWSVYALYRAPAAPTAVRPLVGELLASSTQSIGVDRIRDTWSSLLEEAAARLAASLHLCFAAGREQFSEVRVALRSANGEPVQGPFMGQQRHLSDRIAALVGVGEVLWLKLRDYADAAGRPPAEISAAEMPQEVRDDVAKKLEWLVSSAVFVAHWPRCTVLPAERTAVDLFAKELSLRRTELVDEVVEAELEGRTDVGAMTRQVGRYAWPIRDSLRTASDLARLARFESPFRDLATELEMLLGGAVGQEHGELQFAPLGGSAKPIGIHLASSLVKSLVSMVFFFRHQARASDLLIIDEPELNLHPDNQRKVARILAKAVNRGLRVILSTHSDYILREFNNLVLLSRDTEAMRALRAKYGYKDDELLAPSKVGPYLFLDGRADLIPVGEDGFEVKTIEDEINRTNMISQEIYAVLS